MLFSTFWGGSVYAADLGSTTVFDKNGLKVDFKVDSQWEGFFNGTMTVTNTGTQPVEDWALTFDFPHEISNIWNAAITEHQPGVYTVKNLVWNQDIPVGGSINFGFTAAASGEITRPTFFVVNTKTTEVASDLIKVEYVLYSDWGSGYSAALKITNLSAKTIEDWTIDFDFARSISNLSCGKILAQNGTHYTIQNDGYTQNLSAGQTIQLGLGGSGGVAADVPTNCNVKQIVSGFDLVSDTDGDLVLDWIEICVNGTDPLIPEVIEPTIVPTDEPTIVPTEEPIPTDVPIPTAEPTPKPIIEENIGYAYFKQFDESDIAYDGAGMYYVKNQILLLAKDDMTYKDVYIIAEQYNAEIVGYMESVNCYQIELQTTVSTEELYRLIDELDSSSKFTSVSLNMLFEIETDDYVPQDPWLQSDWDESNPADANWGVEAIRALSAWEYKDIMKTTKIGLIDTYVDTNHEDLNFTTVWNNDNFEGKEGHGTGVAGIMAASANSIGMTGVCLKNSLYAYDIFNKDVYLGSIVAASFSSTTEQMYAYLLMVGSGVKVINVSRGYHWDLAFAATMGNTDARNVINKETEVMTKFFEDLINSGFDFLIVTSSGNWGEKLFIKDSSSIYGYNLYNKDVNAVSDIVQTYDSNGHLVYASVDAKYGYYLRNITSPIVMDRIICVGGMQLSGNGYTLTKSTTRGSRVDIAAPGTMIYTTALNDKYTYNPNATNIYTFGGTSAAAPFVAGVAGLIYSINPSLTGPEVKSILISSADKSAEKDTKRSFYDTVGSTYNTYSLVDAEAAIEMVLQVEELNGHKYKLYDQSMTWDQAKYFCETLGGHLVTISSQEEQIVIEELLTRGLRNSYWIGAEMDANGLYTKWITGEGIYYTNYYDNQPDNCGYQEDVLQVYKNNNGSGTCFGYWNDLNRNGTCYDQAFFGIQNIGFICEWED